MGNVIPIKSGMEADVRAVLAKVTAQAAALGIVMSERSTHLTDEELLCCFRIEIKKAQFQTEKSRQATVNAPEEIQQHSLLPNVQIVDEELLDLLAKVKGTGIAKYKGDDQEGLKEYLKAELAKLDAQQEIEFVKRTVSGMPTDLCRTNPFFGIQRNKLKDRKYVTDHPICESTWGKITYSGPILSIAELKVLVAVLAIVDRTGQYEGSFLPLLQTLGHNQPGAADYKRVFAGLQMLHGASLGIKLDKDRERSIEMKHVVTVLKWKSKGESNNLHISVDKYFAKCLAGDAVTYIEPQKINKLTAVATLLYLFVMSQRKSKWPGGIEELSKALKLDGMAKNQLRRVLNLAILELVEKGLLLKKSFIKKDTIVLYRAGKSQAEKGGVAA